MEFAGQATIEILGRGRFPVTGESHYVPPRAYQPLGAGPALRRRDHQVRFTAYQLMAGTLGNHELVTLPGAHPTARIDTGAADYNADANRLLK